jgi:riboflavin synthase
MFTGIVEHMGTVVAVSENDTTESGGNGWTVTVGDAACILDDCHIGDSISINGTSMSFFVTPLQSSLAITHILLPINYN